MNVTEAIWTFHRNEERLSIKRSWNLSDTTLVVTIADSPRSFAFQTVGSLERFQHDMETFLLRTGWTLAAFSPERRKPGDRRSFPREENDRRRWWTDPHSPLHRLLSRRKADAPADPEPSETDRQPTRSR